MMIHWQEVLGTIAVWNVAAYALSTFPPPENKYARWFMGVLQFIVANHNKAKEAFQGPQDLAPTKP